MLPHPLASFVGREAERKRLGSSIRQHLLTTLVGPPGVGKTRLAVETARGLGGGQVVERERGQDADHLGDGRLALAIGGRAVGELRRLVGAAGVVARG